MALPQIAKRRFPGDEGMYQHTTGLEKPAIVASPTRR
jgi:hypothetical protein